MTRRVLISSINPGDFDVHSLVLNYLKALMECKFIKERVACTYYSRMHDC